MFVWSDIVVYCCWMLPLSLRYAPSHAWRLVSVRVCPPVRAFVCECVCVCVCLRASGWFSCLAFRRMEMSTIIFGLKVFHHGGGEDAAFFWVVLTRLQLHVCLVFSVRVRVRCMTCSLRLGRARFST